MGFDRRTADDDTSAADRSAQPAAGKRARTDGLVRSPAATSSTSTAGGSPAKAGAPPVDTAAPFSLHLTDEERAAEHGTEDGRDLAESADLAGRGLQTVLSQDIPAFAAARDRLDADAAAGHAERLTDRLDVAIRVRAQLAPRVDPNAKGYRPPAGDDAGADIGRLTPRWATLGAILPAALSRAAEELGPHRFAGRPVLAGAGASAVGAGASASGADLSDPSAYRVQRRAIDREAGHTLALLREAAEIRDAWIGAAGMPTPALEQQIGARLAGLAGRPAHLAFVKSALASLGLWEHIQQYTAPKAQRDPSSFGGILANAAAPDRTVADVDAASQRQAGQFGAMVDLGSFDQATAIELLRADTSFTYLDDGHTEVSRSSKNARQVLAMMQGLEPGARAAVLRHFLRTNVLDLFAGGLPWRIVKQLDAELASGFGDVRAELARYYLHRNTADHSLSTMLERIPGVGGALETVGNVATFGFLRSHDESYRAERQGAITSQEHAANTGQAAAVAGVGMMLSTLGGQLGASAAKGLAGALLGDVAGTTAGRLATTTAIGAGGGAGGAVGAQAGQDLVRGELSDAETYGDAAATGAGIGAIIGGGLGAAGEVAPALAGRLSPAAQARLAHLVRRFPSIPADGPIMQALANLGERAGAAAGRATVRAVAPAAAVLDALAVGALQASAQVRAALERAARAGDQVAARGLRAVGLDPSDLGQGPPPATAGSYGTPPPAPGAHVAIDIAGDEASATVLNAQRVGDDVDALTNHVGEGPEAAGMHIIDGSDDAVRQRQATAAADHSNIGSRTPLAEHIPPPGPEFVQWWDSLTLRELNEFLSDVDAGGLLGAETIIANNVRHPGGLHEWLMVMHQQQIKRWNVSLQTVLDARTRTEAAVGRRFRHGGPGSGRMHQQLNAMIEGSPTYDTFLQRLNEWADRELFPVRGPRGEPPLGRYYLPRELQLR
jgi:hypothetical protein